jgi:branched-chain amino acid transport system permease protein
LLDGVVSGLVSGSAYAIVAVCVVVLYRLVGVLNFSQAALGAFGAYACYSILEAGTPLVLAVLAGLVASAGVAGFVGWVLSRWFANPTVIVRSVISAVLFLLILSAGFRLFGDSPRAMPSLVSDATVDVAGVRVSVATIVALLLALAIALGLTLLLRFTQIGLRLQAMSERPVTVQLLGINARRLTVIVWASTGVLSTLAMLLIAPTRNPTFESMSFLIVPALAAALVGSFSNVWVTTLAAVLIGAIEGGASRVEGLSDYRGVLPTVIIIVTLAFLRRREVWDAVR